MSTRTKVWDWVVAYLIPGRIYRPWTKYVYGPIRYHYWPWDQRSACEDCPMCQEGDTQ